MQSALNIPPSRNAPTEAEAVNGPAVLAQPPVTGASGVAARPVRSGLENEREALRPKLDVVKGVLTSAQGALTSGYRTVSSSTDEFAHDSPWKSIAFAVLGGIIVGMLIAR
ncbi:glycine zipper domain-containing protein [Paraburkholderia aspalathi]|uniref:glycine zipper domain-containing protein n=1 Tax=Paraburkholderia aspalathi TaxID=1324617 RepID=UPI0038BE0EF2